MSALTKIDPDELGDDPKHSFLPLIRPGRTNRLIEPVSFRREPSCVPAHLCSESASLHFGRQYPITWKDRAEIEQKEDSSIAGSDQAIASDSRRNLLPMLDTKKLSTTGEAIFSHHRWNCGICTILVVLFVIITLVTMLMLQSAGGTKNFAAEDQNIQYIFELRHKVMNHDSIPLSSDTTPQLLATEWMAFEDRPRLSLDAPGLGQRFAVLTVCFAGSSTWNIENWGFGGINECDWPAIECDSHGSIISLDFSLHFDKEGHLPEEIGLLTDLKFLSLSHNELGSNIPASLFDLTNLVELDLSHNRFTGTVYESLNKLTNLEVLRLNDNWISGDFPLMRQPMSRLKIFDISRCVLLGESNIWPNIVVWPNLEEFRIREIVQLLDTIPSQLGMLSRLKVLDFSLTQTRGTLPNQLESLVHLETLHFDSTRIHGNLPTGIGKLTKLESFLASFNSFGGATIPTEFGYLSNLATFEVQHSMLEGTIPSFLAQMTRLENMNLDNNDLTGRFPPEFGNCTKLRLLSVAGNSRLHGSIPSTICEADHEVLVYADCSVQCSCCYSRFGC